MYCIVFEITRLSQTKGKNKTTTTMLKQFKNPNKKVVESGKPEFYSICIDDRSLSRLVTGMSNMWWDKLSSGAKTLNRDTSSTTMFITVVSPNQASEL